MNTKENIFISQTSYAKKIIERFRINKSKKVATPLDANIKLNIIFSISLVNHFVQSPKKSQLDAAKRILKYVNSTLDLGSFYKNDIHLELHGSAYADLGGDLDNRRSTSDYVFLYGYACISWCSKKQQLVYLSTTVA
ncbi:unnamed protein product, partial [Musa hybrid cultivar]